MSAFTFGGGFVIISLMKREFVDKYKWIDEKEMLDITALAQATPGAIAVNASILIGYKLAGLKGSLITLFGTIIPPFIILSIISVSYEFVSDNIIIGFALKGMQAGVAAIILDVAISMILNLVKDKKTLSLLWLGFAFIAIFIFKLSIIIIIVVSGIMGYLYSSKNRNLQNKKS